jgi:serpin B
MSLKPALMVIAVSAVLIMGGMTYIILKAPGNDKDGSQSVVPGPTIPATPSNSTNNSSPNTTGPGPENSNVTTGDPGDLQELVNASNRFALEMFSNLSNAKDNLFFSPYSIFTALGMTYEGARNKTADEIRSVFHFPADDQTRWSLFKALIEKLNANNTGCNLSTANAMWVQQGFHLLQTYIDALETYYKSSAFDVDFAQALEESRLKINYWVENQTNGKIKDLFPAGSLDPATCLVLTNAIYFKGDWLKEFNQSQTEQMAFHPDSTSTVQVQMMVRDDEKSSFNYADLDGLQALEMKYTGEKLSMLVLLPDGDSTSSIEKAITPQKLSEWRGKLKEQRVDVFFPKFKLDTKYYLKDNLSKMGMPTAFSPAADFSGIDGQTDLSIALVVHQAYVSADEKGTEAAAATGVSVEFGAIGPSHPTFNADHPFIFIIQDRETGNILFMGKMVDPTR